MEKILLSLASSFFWPVSCLVLAAFCYAVIALGAFVVEAIQRAWYPRHLFLLKPKPELQIEALELQILRELEGLRLCSRVAPMLGLVATMIPLGPALVRSTMGGDPSELANGLAPAFAAVILSLLAAATTFTIYTVRRRWLLQELHQVVGSNSTAAQATS